MLLRYRQHDNLRLSSADAKRATSSGQFFDVEKHQAVTLGRVLDNE